MSKANTAKEIEDVVYRCRSPLESIREWEKKSHQQIVQKTFDQVYGEQDGIQLTKEILR